MHQFDGITPERFCGYRVDAVSCVDRSITNLVGLPGVEKGDDIR